MTATPMRQNGSGKDLLPHAEPVAHVTAVGDQIAGQSLRTRSREQVPVAGRVEGGRTAAPVTTRAVACRVVQRAAKPTAPAVQPHL